MKKCFLAPLCELIAFHNRLERFKIAQPEIQPLTECMNYLIKNLLFLLFTNFLLAKKRKGM